jgi:cell division protein FtsL
MSREERIIFDRIRADRIRADRKSLIKFLAVVMLGVFVLIGMRSYGAIIQHENNVLAEENAYIQAEIDSLNSQIVEETKVTKIERVATEDFGMVYPTPENCIRLGDGDDDDGDKGLADAIRTEAYK